ncbi:MAG TPA: hypothetical protein ENI80_01110 [Acidiferrobacteraceae bacterium]|nr:hypothetical protein [Acidiferrobacteraceae bacterium]
MKDIDPISDECLNAFVDDQLGAEEKERVFKAVNDDPALGKRICEIRALQEMVKHAYQQVQMPERLADAPRQCRLHILWPSLAAGLLLLIGAGLGWVGHTQLGSGSQLDQIVVSDATMTLQLTANKLPTQQPPGVILHLNSNNPAKLVATLVKTEALLKSYARHGKPVPVEVVVNSKGLDLLRTDVSSEVAHIQALLARYDNVSFLACQRAIKRFKYETGTDAKLLAEALVAPSALGQILIRLQQGWTYIQI